VKAVLQDQLDAIDQLSDSEVRFVAKIAYTDMFRIIENNEREEAKLKKEYEELLEDYEDLLTNFNKHKNKLRKFFGL
jgi:hypothetical protein